MDCNLLFMKTLSERVLRTRQTLRLSQMQLAEMAGIKQQSLQKIESGKTKHSKYINEIAKALTVDPGWLQFGTGKFPSHIFPDNENEPQNLTSETLVMDWEDLFEIAINKDKPAHKNLKFIPYYRENEACFALQVKDDSMVSPGTAKSYVPGEYIIINPELRPEKGDLVIAICDDEVLFRRFLTYSKKHYLSPFNTSYPAIEIDEKSVIFCGVIISSLYILK